MDTARCDLWGDVLDFDSVGQPRESRSTLGGSSQQIGTSPADLTATASVCPGHTPALSVLPGPEQHQEKHNLNDTTHPTILHRTQVPPKGTPMKDHLEGTIRTRQEGAESSRLRLGLQLFGNGGEWRTWNGGSAPVAEGSPRVRPNRPNKDDERRPSGDDDHVEKTSMCRRHHSSPRRCYARLLRRTRWPCHRAPLDQAYGTRDPNSSRARRPYCLSVPPPFCTIGRVDHRGPLMPSPTRDLSRGTYGHQPSASQSFGAPPPHGGAICCCREVIR